MAHIGADGKGMAVLDDVLVVVVVGEIVGLVDGAELVEMELFEVVVGDRVVLVEVVLGNALDGV
jgi:hypothetical protein